MCFLQVGTKSLKSESMCGKKEPEKGWREKKGKGEARDFEVVHGTLTHCRGEKWVAKNCGCERGVQGPAIN